MLEDVTGWKKARHCQTHGVECRWVQKKWKWEWEWRTGWAVGNAALVWTSVPDDLAVS